MKTEYIGTSKHKGQRAREDSRFLVYALMSRRFVPATCRTKSTEIGELPGACCGDEMLQGRRETSCVRTFV